MNYYQNSKNGYSMNHDDCYNDEYYFDDSINYQKDCYNNDKNDYGHKKSCCVRKVEETFCCFPSYYNEEKKEEDKKEKCFEGTFKICPKYDHNEKDDCKNNIDNENNNKRDEHKCGCRCNNRCGFCGLFGRW